MSAPADYDPSDYPAFAVTVDLALFTIHEGTLSVLLIQRGDDPYAGHWALPGGFVGIEEDAATAAWRELAEETGLERFSGHLEQLATYSDPGRDPRMRGGLVAHLAFAPGLARPGPTAGSDAAAARWWPVEDLALGGSHPPAVSGEGGIELAFDHAVILRDALERVRSKIEYTTLAAQFVDEPFTLADLRRVYAAVWGPLRTWGNFRRKVLSTPGFVVATESLDEGEGRPGRPALLYRRGPATDLQPAMLRPERLGGG